MLPGLHFLYGAFAFLLGSLVGSFANVCIYRLPLEKSVLWPSSRCPKCFNPIPWWGNVPILSWIFLRGRCYSCKSGISPRYALIEALMGALFLAFYMIDVYLPDKGGFGAIPDASFLPWAYHCAFAAVLVVATFTDFDFQLIPAPITDYLLAVGLVMGILAPGVRPDLTTANLAWKGVDGMWDGFVVGMVGVAVGGGLVWATRVLGSWLAGREAMGLGDVYLLAGIGAFLGWQGAVLTFFLAPFFGLGVALWKIVAKIAKTLTGRKITRGDRVLAFGPYLCLASLVLALTWRWAWPRIWFPYFEAPYVLWLYVTGSELPPLP
jgi:leader peptidase (prepilin peptidase)/N-methyltransferase